MHAETPRFKRNTKYSHTVIKSLMVEGKLHTETSCFSDKVTVYLDLHFILSYQDNEICCFMSRLWSKLDHLFFLVSCTVWHTEL